MYLLRKIFRKQQLINPSNSLVLSRGPSRLNRRSHVSRRQRPRTDFDRESNQHQMIVCLRLLGLLAGLGRCCSQRRSRPDRGVLDELRRVRQPSSSCWCLFDHFGCVQPVPDPPAAWLLCRSQFCPCGTLNCDQQWPAVSCQASDSCMRKDQTWWRCEPRPNGAGQETACCAVLGCVHSSSVQQLTLLCVTPCSVLQDRGHLGRMWGQRQGRPV